MGGWRLEWVWNMPLEYYEAVLDMMKEADTKHGADR